jgi:hypothetical protein
VACPSRLRKNFKGNGQAPENDGQDGWRLTGDVAEVNCASLERMSQDTKWKIDDFIARSFRDVADADYLVARICWKRELGHQFFWMALQAVEKYLKGILLFNRKPIHSFSHNLIKALREAKRLPAVDLKLTPELEDFIHILNEEGPNRYFEWNLLLRGHEILLLDKLVWHLRVRCVALDEEVKEGGKVIWTSKSHFQQIKNYQPGKNLNRIRIPYGLLERILTSKSEVRKDLVWKNFYWGNRYKQRIKFSPQFRFESSYLAMRPEIFPELNRLVKFSKNVLEHFQSPAKRQASLKPWRVQW